MKLIVGLGNPGRKYQNTRHNVGFEVVAELARSQGWGPAKSAYNGEVVEGNLGGERLLLLCPHTFMNRSGGSVQQAQSFYKLEPADVMVVCDDMNLPLGKLRFRAAGSAGGQKGLADIIRCLGTEAVPRLRVGIDRPPPQWDPADYVLGRLTKEERAEMDLTVARAADALGDWVREGIEACMNRYN